jgi:hypothetical protein
MRRVRKAFVAKTVVRDFIPDLAASKGYVVDKLEGLAVHAAGGPMPDPRRDRGDRPAASACG